MKHYATCTICNKEYRVKRYKLTTTKYCSRDCQHKGAIGKPAWNKSVWPVRSCNVCGKEYSMKPSALKGSKYCSLSCQAKGGIALATRTSEWKANIGAAIKGLKRSPETKEKIRAGKIGHKQSKEQIQKRVEKNRGQKRTEEERRRMSVAAPKGDKAYFWKGGVTPIHAKIRTSLEYREWKIKVFVRDNRTCAMCGYRGKKINADHIKPFSLFPELRFDIDNGRTLCEPCHKKTPTYGHNARYLTRENFIKAVNT